MPRFDPSLIYSDPLYRTLLSYLQWRSVRGCPRSMRLPQPAIKWTLQNGQFTGEEGFCTEHATNPPETRRLEVFGEAFLSIPEHRRFFILDAVILSSHPWLKGPAWSNRLRSYRISRPQFERLLARTWRDLKAEWEMRRPEVEGEACPEAA